MAYGPACTSHMLTLHILKDQVQKKSLVPRQGGGGTLLHVYGLY